MGRIAVLPETIASRIAAGEVVERPSSALKELIENAIDAGARAIDIVLEAGGRDAIVVTDDGEGMGPDDLLLALERHATSKIRSDADIEQVRTLGFRGEAVPAIASVSRFRMSSRDPASEIATFVEVHGGRVVSVGEEAAPRGTRVEVRGLFYNAPARRKFLRSSDTERQRAIEIVSRFAVGYPAIRFRLSADGRPIFDHAPVASPLERCSQVFGRQMTSGMLALEASSGPLGLTGLCSGLETTRAHARDQQIHVNRRPVRDRLLSHAVSAAYADTLPPGRHPVVIVLLEVPPELVDVNVHPAKSEVRFRRPSEVHEFLVASLRRALRSAGAAPILSAGAAPRVESSGFRDPETRTDVQREGAAPGRAFAFDPVLPGSGGFTYARSRFGTESAGSASLAPRAEDGPWTASQPGEVAYRPASSAAPFAAPLGQFLDSYILASEGGALLIIDQHAAHERVLFESIFREGQARPASAQRLLDPVAIELAPADRSRAEEYASALQEAGFEAEPFGEGALLLRAVPAGLDIPELERFVRDVLSDLRDGQAIAPTGERGRKVAASIACHAAIKVHFPLTAAKMAWLVTELFSCATPTTCPHGRPAVLRFGLDQIERGFHRR